jgi:hypothetical protein
VSRSGIKKYVFTKEDEKEVDEFAKSLSRLMEMLQASYHFQQSMRAMQADMIHSWMPSSILSTIPAK